MDAEVQLLELQGSKIWLIDNVLEKPNNLFNSNYKSKSDINYLL